MLGCVEIEHERGLAGHSDADVLAHAICDALLGAAALGDLGAHFPDSDPRWEGASGATLLGEVARLLEERGWQVGNVDATVIAEQPRLDPFRARMQERIAAALGLEAACVSVKATTTEGLGACGRGEGIAATAVTTIYEPKKT